MPRVIRLVRWAFFRLLGRPEQKIPTRLRLGNDVFIGDYVTFDNIADGALIEIGDEATIADEVIILVHDASSNRRIGKTWIAPVKIGNRSFIGARSVLLPGVTIGDDAVIGAGSVVTHDVEAGTIAAGAPARTIGFTQSLDDKRQRLSSTRKQFSYWTHDRNHPLKPEYIDEMVHAARRDGGFFIIKETSNELSNNEKR